MANEAFEGSKKETTKSSWQRDLSVRGLWGGTTHSDTAHSARAPPKRKKVRRGNRKFLTTEKLHEGEFLLNRKRGEFSV